GDTEARAVEFAQSAITSRDSLSVVEELAPFATGLLSVVFGDDPERDRKVALSLDQVYDACGLPPSGDEFDGVTTMDRYLSAHERASA
ncbi:MAG: hypothetical protein AAFU85_24425, partial [Planctomycetota bacterium]